MLFHQRERQQQLHAAEAEGQSLWTQDLSREARFRLKYAFDDLNSGMQIGGRFAEEVRSLVLSELGLPSLAGQHFAEDDIFRGLITSSPDIVFSILEAAMIVGKDLQESNYGFLTSVRMHSTTSRLD